MSTHPENPTPASAPAAMETREASQRVRSDDGSARIAFKLTFLDATGKEKTIGALWLDVPKEGAWEPVPDDFPGGHWEHVSRMEKWAKLQLLADVDCSMDIEALIAPRNNPVSGAALPRSL